MKQRPLYRMELAERWKPYLVPAPADAMSVPTMMNPSERALLYGLARDWWTGEGLIIDAGIFLGASTRCLGQGVRDSGKSFSGSGRPVVSLELGLVNPGMQIIFKREGIGQGLSVGDSFAPLVEQQVAPVSDLVDLRFGDVMKHGQIDQPIEILFLDLIKKSTINHFVAENWFTRLIPGRTIVIQQDYLLESLPFIRVQQEYFASKFAYLGELGPTAVFRCVEEITPAEVAEMKERTRDPMEQIRLGSLAIYRSSCRARQVLMHAGVFRQIVSLRGVDAATPYWRSVREQYDDVFSTNPVPKRIQQVAQSLEFIISSDGSARSLQKATQMAYGLIAS